MGIRFVIGRAGSGKTHHCLDAVHQALRRDPIDGPRLILLVPEQAGLQMERAILEPDDIGGAHRADVVSFQRLSQRVLDATGAPAQRTLSEPGRAMVLRHLIAQNAKQLRYYRKLDRMAGFVDHLCSTMTELIQEAVDPAGLAAAAEGLDQTDLVQQAKLHDVQLIFRAYLDYLSQGRLDPSQYLELARHYLPRCTWLHGAHLWVDGFASFSRQEMLTLVALAKLCQEIDIALLMDPALCSGGMTSAIPDMAMLFGRTARTYDELSAAFRSAGLTIDQPLVLAPEVPPRYAQVGALGSLERSLFSTSDRTAKETPVPAADLQIVELPSRRVEVDYAVAQVCQWVQADRDPYRYRDVAIIVRDLDLYHDQLGQALQSRGIPYFIDRRRPIAHHPLVELLRAAVAVAADDLSLESIRLLLKTDLLPIAAGDADELENYLLAHGVAGAVSWRTGDWTAPSRATLSDRDKEPDPETQARLERVNATRRHVLSLIDGWITTATTATALTGDEWAGAVTQWLDQLGVAETLEAWAREAEGDGDADQAAEHRQVWRDADAFLDDLANAFSETPLSLNELGDVFESGLAGLTLGLAPPMVDQLLVGSIERSRHPDIKAAIILGFNDGVFPSRPAEDSILNDDDRRQLRQHGVRVAAPTRERVLDEAMLVYIALTRASQSLVITYARADNDGKSLHPSPYVAVLMRACPGLCVSHVGDPVRRRDIWDVQTAQDLTSRLVLELRHRPTSDGEDGGAQTGGSTSLRAPSRRAQWNELYTSIREAITRDAAGRRALQSLAPAQTARLAPTTVERLLRGPLRTSVSRLETFATCPFKYFAAYTLNLREREEVDLAPLDIGQVHHAILEDFITTLSARKTGLGQLTDQDLARGLQESCDRTAGRLNVGGPLSDARNAYVLRRSASFLNRVLRAQRDASRAGQARPRYAELAFGAESSGGLPSLELTTPSGRRVVLRGFIDRVDLAELGDELLGIVVDYKRTRDKQLKLDSVYHGLSLQLPGYLLVLAEHGQSLAGRPIRPVAGLYVSLASRYEPVDHPEHVNERNTALGGTYGPRGIIAADGLPLLDPACASGRSLFYNAYLKKDGDIGDVDRSDAAEVSAFEAVLAHTRKRLGELADGILDGDIAVRPYRLGNFSPCSWCPMHSVCRFEMGISDVRYLDSLKRSEVFTRLTRGGA